MTAHQFPVDQLADEVANVRRFAESVDSLMEKYRTDGLDGTAAYALLGSLHTALLAFVDAPADPVVRAEAERLGALFVDLANESGAQV
ncbi:hypothetical protein ACFWXO_05140 [Kitasatospora sp. NPDC059088]|uniref:hypothetical protein n=1 Tax=Kitasatospora sp. NPDC059088 TaxID=3346722 RepID=UPI0036793B3A